MLPSTRSFLWFKVLLAWLCVSRALSDARDKRTSRWHIRVSKVCNSGLDHQVDGFSLTVRLTAATPVCARTGLRTLGEPLLSQGRSRPHLPPRRSETLG